MLSSRHRCLQTLAPAQTVAGVCLAVFLGLLLCDVRSIFRYTADRNWMVHLFCDRSGSLLFSRAAGKCPYAFDAKNREILLRCLFASLLCDLDRFRCLQAAE